MASITTRSKSRNLTIQLQIESSTVNQCGIFNIIECEYDGDCLFSSILPFVTQYKRYLKTPPSEAHQIRLHAVDYIFSKNAAGFQSNWDRFYENIKFNLASRIAGLSQYGENDRKDELIKKSYREYMSKAGNFGTFSELCASAELYGFCGYIFIRDETNNYSCFDFGLTGNVGIDRAKPILYLLFTGPTDSGHFRRLEPSIAPTILLTGKYHPLDNPVLTTNQGSKIVIRKTQGNSSETNSNISVPGPNQNPPQRFVCDVCKESFETKRGLGVHRNRHVKEANEKTATELIARLDDPSETQESSEERNSGPSKQTKEVHKGLSAELESECKQWLDIFRSYENSEALDESAFDKDVKLYLEFLFKANEKLPGPKHPAVKFFRLRQKKKNAINSAQYSRSSNPQRNDKKNKQRRRDRYQYDLTQYWYYNQRRKAVLEVMKSGKTRYCKIKMEVLEEHFQKTFGNSNDRIRESYPTRIRKENIALTPADIQKNIKRISLDTSAGPDRVLARCLRKLNVSDAICSLANTMLKSSFVPSSFRMAKLLLIDKDEDASNVNNWRPIMIFSVVRRVIEKALESILRCQVEINSNQRGFVIGIPGCHINSRLINACLKDAKRNKRVCIVVFLDVTKAFDRIGHLHILKSLEANGVSQNLQNLVMNLLSQNQATISTGKESSKTIDINCGVPQGGPLSPLLFNIAINFLYEEICDPQFAETYGYKLSNEHDATILSGFADDQAITTGKNEESAVRVIEMVQSLFSTTGLEINPAKSQAIIIKGGKLVQSDLRLSNGDVITSINADERINYLGCSFNSELIFDNSCIESLNRNLNNISASPLLKPDQKLSIINQYIFPTLTYPLQTAPLNKIPQYVTDGLDVMIRRTVKEIIGLPMHTNDNLFYSPRRLRGLGLVKTSWEIFLQHFAIAKKLSSVNDELFQSISNCSAEMTQCVEALNVEGNNTKMLRMALRQKSYEAWCNMKYQGAGVVHFQNHVKSNDFVCNKNSLSSSEWTAAMKLNCNYANLNGVPGVVNTSNLCRKCNREIESISHVSGSCLSNNQQIISRHHNTKHQLTVLLQEKRWHCFEEVYAIDTDGRSRFSDIIAINPASKEAFIIDPTIRYETSDPEQDDKVRSEKEEIYIKCIPYYEDKYTATFGKCKWKVRGLWFGSRGTVGKSVTDFFKELKLDSDKIKGISEDILIRTIKIINNHIYS